MTLIIKRGSISRTPHTEFYIKPGILALEEIHGCYGFSGPWSRKLHVRSYPTEQVKPPIAASFNFVAETPKEATVLQPYLIQTKEMPIGGDALRSRACVAYGSSTRLSVLKPKESFAAEEFFRNGERHELYYVHDGEGVLYSEYGRLPFKKEMYIIVPKGTTYRIEIKSPAAYMLVIESLYPVDWPAHYMNYGGQATMSAPVVETEIGTPEFFEPIDMRGEFPIFVQHDGGLVSKLTLGHHPFDVGGWEGALYPFTFDINNHHGIAREIHTAPPVHQTFQCGQAPYNGFSVCSFVPQMEGWHPKEVPAPYAHYNVDSDELMFFCNATYEARKGVIQEGSLTFHPGGTPHSPHGSAAQKSFASRGKVSTRLAVMLDTFFESLKITSVGYQYREAEYAVSWDEAKHMQGVGSA